MNVYEQHKQDVELIRQQLLKATQNSTSGITLCQTSHSNMTRSSPYKAGKVHLDIHKLNRILEIDVEQQVAIVEPRVTMEGLLNATLKHGLIPAVLPEFKGITVGGAIMGAALESSSHLYGQFNDNCLAYDVLLGDGTLVEACPENHADLFYGLSGSYGSLGLLMCIKLALIPAKEHICLSYERYHSIQDAIQAMNAKNTQESPPDFLEGVAFDPQHVIVVEGRFADNDAVTGLKKVSLGNSWSPWYYQHLAQIKTTPYQDCMSTRDYLFRFDRGAFWMGSYVLHGPLLWKFIRQTFFNQKRPINDLSQEERQRYHQLRFPNLLQRMLLGWGMTTQNLYPILHGKREEWFDQRFVIQDYYIPNKQVAAFTERVFSELGINPIWLCPIKSTNTSQFLSPHYLSSSPELMYDVGVYGMPLVQETLHQVNRQLENWTEQAGGRKMLYSTSFYNSEDFWNIYSLNSYQKLRQNYHAEGVWISIENKVLI